MRPRITTTTILYACIACLILISSASLVFDTWQYASGSIDAFRDVPRAITQELFFDLRIWTENGVDCPIPIEELGGNNHCAEHLGYPFNYPRIPLYFWRNLGLTADATQWLGLTIGIVAMAALALYLVSYTAWSRKTNRWLGPCCGMTLVAAYESYPWRYATERSQLDLVVLILLVPSIIALAKALQSKDRVNYSMVLCSGLLLAITSLIKFYTLLPLTILFILSIVWTKQHKSIGASLSCAGLLGLLITCFVLLTPSFGLIRGNLSGLGGHGFGFKTLLDAGYNQTWIVGAGIKTAVFISSTLAGMMAFNRLRSSNVTTTIKGLPTCSVISSFSASAIICCGSFLVALYLISESINYRWVLMALIVPSLIELSLTKKQKLEIYFPMALLCVFLSMASLSIPFNPSFYIYTEWIQSFIWHPFIFGSVAALLIESLRFAMEPAVELKLRGYEL